MIIKHFTWIPKLAVVAAMGLMPATMATAQSQDQNRSQEQNRSSDQQQDRNSGQNQDRSSNDNQDRNRDARDNDRDRDRDRDRSNQDRTSDRQRDDRRADDQRWEDDQRRMDDQRRQDEQRWQDQQRQNAGSHDQTGGLGVAVVEGNRGVRVVEVKDDSPAQKAGIQRNDEILSIGDRQIDTAQRLVDFVKMKSPGDEVQVRLVRNGQEQTVRATLETRREALNYGQSGRDQQDRSADSRMQREQRFYRDGSPPWSGDDVTQHVDQLERQVQDLQQQLRELRQMLDNDPSGRDYEYSSNRNNSSTSYQNSRTDSRRSNNDMRDRENDRRMDDRDNRSGSESDRRSNRQ